MWYTGDPRKNVPAYVEYIGPLAATVCGELKPGMRGFMMYEVQFFESTRSVVQFPELNYVYQMMADYVVPVELLEK